MNHVLYATIDGNQQEQGTYSQLNMVLSRIKQLDEQYEFLGISRPTEYKIILVKGK